MRFLVLVLSVLTGLAGTAAAGKHSKMACGTADACLRACSVKNKKACDRLFALVEPELESYREYRGYELPVFKEARTKLPAVCKKHQRSCVLLGVIEELGLGGVAADTASAKTRFEAACSAGESAGCVALGDAYRSGTLPGSSRDLARDTYDDACDKGQADACGKLGEMTMLGSSYKDQDVAGGTKLLDEACDKKSAWSCARLGRSYKHGYPTKQDTTLAARYYRKGCKLGHNQSCYMVVTGTIDDADRKMLDKQCKTGDVVVCSQLAYVEKDAKKKAEYEELTCYAGETYRCETLAASLRDPKTGTVAKKDRKRYQELLGIACDAGGGAACVTLAKADLPQVPRAIWDDQAKKYVEPKKTAPPSKKVVAKVVKKLGTLCDGGNASACYEAAMILSEEFYGAVDADEAHRRGQAYCDLTQAWREEDYDMGYGSQECWELNDIDARAANVTNKKKCDGGDLDACATYGRYSWGDDKARRKALEKACTGQIAAACADLAIQKYYAKESTDVTAVATACEGGDGPSCDWLAASYDVDQTVAARAATRGCELGNAYTCTELGRRAYEGAGMAKNLDEAIRAYARACSIDAGSWGCTRVGELEAEKTKNDQIAACNRGDGVACLAIGEVEKACTGKQAEGCALAADRQTDPVRRRDLLQAACDLGRSDACNTVGALWQQTGDRTKATTAYVKACEAAVYGACSSAVALLRPTDPKDKGSSQYRAVLDRGCLQGDSYLCDEAKYGIGGAPTTVAAADTSSPTPEVPYTPYRPAKKKAIGHGRLEIGYLSATPEGQDAVTGYYAGLASRGFSAGKMGAVALLRGQLSYDAQKEWGHDAAFGLGIHYHLGPFHAQGLGVGGRDRATLVDASWYYGFELAGSTGLGAWSLEAAYDRLYRSESDETRFELSIQNRRASGKRIGLGLRSTKYTFDTATDVSQFGLFGTYGW